MLDDKGFDSWAYEYDADVAQTDERGDYPFAGYAQVLGRIAETVCENGSCDVLDAGFGTGILAKKLYDAGCRVYGQDYSKTMISIAQEKMPGALLCYGDLDEGLAEPLQGRQYDFILATYALHHFTTERKVRLLKMLQEYLKPEGKILIGDIAFADEAGQAACRARFEDEWDENEIYLLFDEIRQYFPHITYDKISHCCGLFMLPR